jgi:hypothetical protein
VQRQPHPRTNRHPSWIRRPRRGLVLSAAVVVAVSACAGADASTTNDAPPASTAAEATTAPPPTTAVTAGVTYTPPEGDYRATFPVQPTEETQSVPLPDGGSFELKIVHADLEDSSLATGRGTYPDGYEVDPAAGLQGAQDQTIASLGASLTGSREISLDGLPGREFSASVTSNGQGGTLLERMYLDGLTVYEVLRTGAGELSFDDPESVAFFDSFALTP